MLLIIFGLMALQSILSLSGFYLVEQTAPPRFALLILPSLILISLLFTFTSCKKFLDTLDIELLTLIHTIRIPVEFILWVLFLHGMIPELMTFEGRNFDILAGITAPAIYYLYFRKKKISKSIVLGWNILSLVLLLNIVTHAILSIPSFIQQLAFDQPNIAVLHFPFVWLPSLIVPIVLFSHFVVIRQLRKI